MVPAESAAGARAVAALSPHHSEPASHTRTSGLPGVVERPADSRRALLRRVQIALKPASKTLGLHGVFIRGKGLKYMFTDSAFKRVQVDASAYWRDTGEPHRGLAPRTGGTLNCSEWNDGRQGLRLGHDASLSIGGSTTLSVTGNAWGGGAVIVQVCASGDVKRESIRGYVEAIKCQTGCSGAASAAGNQRRAPRRCPGLDRGHQSADQTRSSGLPRVVWAAFGATSVGVAHALLQGKVEA